MDFVENIPEKRLPIIIYSVGVTVVLLVAFLIGYPGALSLGSFDVSYAPKLHAFINGTTAVLLVVGYTLIRARRINAHRVVMMSALFLSLIFLLSYVVYHSQQAEPVRFAGEGMIRSVYYFILITHIVLAAVIVPMAMFTIVRSWRGEFEKHKRIAKVTLPLWFYVAVTGVVVYYMLYVMYTPV